MGLAPSWGLVLVFLHGSDLRIQDSPEATAHGEAGEVQSYRSTSSPGLVSEQDNAICQMCQILGRARRRLSRWH